MAEHDPSRIMTIGGGYMASRVLLTAVGFGLFTELARRTMTVSEICARFALKHRPALDALDLLVSLDLLARDGDGPAARYANTPETALFLDKASPVYIGGILELWERRNYGFWSGLGEALRTGEAQSEIKTSGRSFFETLYEDEAGLEAFMSAMAGASRGNFAALVARFPFGRYRRICDVGGADALLSRMIAARHPSVACTTIDLPKVTALAERRIAEAGLGDRITALAGDFFADPLPKADVITMGMILHDWSLEKKKVLIAKAYEALPPGGALIVIEALIDDARRRNTAGLLMSLTMLIEFGDAFDYSFAEFKAWCAEAGFAKFEKLELTATASAAVAYK